MPTTTIRLSDDLKARVSAAARRAGKTAHDFILDAIVEKADAAERRNDFHEAAEQRYAGIVATGKAIPWRDMRSYLENHLAGKKPHRPSARKLAR